MKPPKLLKWFGFDEEYFERTPRILLVVGIVIVIILSLHFVGFDIFEADNGKTHIVLPF
jgi:hypothetical protein